MNAPKKYLDIDPLFPLASEPALNDGKATSLSREGSGGACRTGQMPQLLILLPSRRRRRRRHLNHLLIGILLSP